MSDTQGVATATAEPTNSVPTQETANTAEDSNQSGEVIEQAAGQTDAQVDANPNLTKTQKQEIKRLNRLRLKVDGREFDEQLPFEIPDTAEARDWMTRNLQFSKVSQKRMQEHAKFQSDAQQFFEELRKNPEKVLADPNVGVDLKKLAAKVIEEEIANSQKSPEQLEKEKLQAELKKLKDDQERERQEFQRKETERLTQQAYEQYDMEMSKALETSDLPKSPYVIKKMADYLYTGLQANVSLTPEEILPLVRDEIQNDIKQMFSVMPSEIIEKIIGKETLNKFRKQNIAKAKGQKEKPPVPVNSAVKQTGETAKKVETEKKQTFRQFFGA